ncbi:MAG: hypothetical protein R6V85_07430 [Polyangia bacterium]
MADLIVRGPGSLSGYSPRMRYLLIEERSVDSSALGEWGNLVAGLIRVEQSDSPGEALRALYSMLRWLRGTGSQQESLRRAVAAWFRQLRSADILIDWDQPPPADEREMDSMIIDKMQRWQEEMRSAGREEGREEGRSSGAGELLERLLELKFGTLDSGTIERIRNAGFESIKNWTARALDASRIEHVFEKKFH